MDTNTVDFLCSLSHQIGINDLMHLAAEDSKAVDDNPINPLHQKTYELATFYALGKIFKDASVS